MTEQERQLLDLLRSVMDADQVALSEAKQAALIVEARIDALNARHEATTGTDGDGALEMLADKHRILLKQKIREQSMELANAMAAMGAAEAQLRNSFGRYNAFRMSLEERKG